MLHVCKSHLNVVFRSYIAVYSQPCYTILDLVQNNNVGGILMINNIRKFCAFTGHRPAKFPWKYNEADRSCAALKAALAQQIEALAAAGVTGWLSGMAQGVDVWAAEIVLELRKKTPTLRLHCVLPCEGQEVKWPASERTRYHPILRQADEVVYVSRTYYPDCMLDRNRYLVDHSTILLAVYDGTYRCGTGMTVRYAQKLGREIIVIDPLTCRIFHS